MGTWFECKVKYMKTSETGEDKVVTELYLLDAVSFSEAEKRINKELEPYISGEFVVTNIKMSNYAELQPNENGDRWFKCKLTFITLDEEKGKERKSNSYVLVQANDVREAYDILDKSMAGMATDYVIPNIAETPIIDVFPYTGEDVEFESDKKEDIAPNDDFTADENFTSEEEVAEVKIDEDFE